MRLLINIGHPAQVHLFKNMMWNLEKKGHDIKITVIDKDVSLQLLDAYGFKYEIVGNAKSSLFSKGTELIKIDYNLYKISKKYKPDILVGGVGNAYVAHVGKLIKKPSIVFDDTEHAKISHFLMDRYATVIFTPSCYLSKIKNQIKYNGFHQLAYLHPNYFKPNPDTLREIGIKDEDERFAIVRFVSWDADHDIGQKGIQNKIEFVKELEKYARVLISTESKLDKELEKNIIKTSPEKLHDLLYYASLYIGEGMTMTTESALLGTPSIYISSLAGTMGNLIELEKYGVVFSYKNYYEALNKAIDIFNQNYTKNIWRDKRDIIFREKIDLTALMVWFIENYPESFTKIRDKEISVYY